MKDLSKSCEGLNKQVSKLIWGVCSVEKRIDVVVLHIVAAPGTDDINGASDDVRRVGVRPLRYCLNLRLVLLVVLQLLRERDRSL